MSQFVTPQVRSSLGSSYEIRYSGFVRKWLLTKFCGGAYGFETISAIRDYMVHPLTINDNSKVCGNTEPNVILVPQNTVTFSRETVAHRGPA